MPPFARAFQIVGVLLLLVGTLVAGAGAVLLAQYDCQSGYGVTAHPSNASATVAYGNLTAPQQRVVNRAVEGGSVETNQSIASALGGERVTRGNDTYEFVEYVSDCPGPWQWLLVYVGGGLALVGALVAGGASAWRRWAREG